MLNYIWIGLIAIGVLVAVGSDLRDEMQNPYRNGLVQEGTLEITRSPGPLRTSYEGSLVIPMDRFNDFYRKGAVNETVRQPVTVSVDPGRSPVLEIQPAEGAPMIWREMAKFATNRDHLAGTLVLFSPSPDGTSARVQFILEPIRFVKMRAVTQTALDYAGTAVNIAIGLIGIMALWLGVMKVAEEAGLLRILTRMLAPVTRRLFPDVPTDHPAVSAIIMNIAANMLGLSNAATPMGLKAMEELNKLNPKLGTATNAMVTFLAINTGGLILIPATAIAVRAAAGSANPGVIIGTSIIGASAATLAGVIASRLLQRLPRYRKELEVDHG